MPRQVRFEYPGASYHVMCRGNHGEAIFLSDEDKKLFLETLVEVWQMMGWEIHAYVLNLIYFRTVSSYIHLNPFRAKLCGGGYAQNLESFLWSSYPAYIGASTRPKWLSCNRVYRTHALPENGPDAIKGYKAILGKQMRGAGDLIGLKKEEEVLKKIRRGWYLGDEHFRDKLVDQVGESAMSDTVRGEVRRLHNEQGAEKVLEEVLKILQLSEKVLLNRKATDVEKQAAAWILHKNTSMTIQWISERLEMGHRSNTSRNIHAFENNDKQEAHRLRANLHDITA